VGNSARQKNQTTKMAVTFIASASDTEDQQRQKPSEPHRTNWVTRFALTFVPTFLSTGILLGVLYVLVMKAIGANRQEVETYLDNLRKRLQAGPVPVIEKVQPVMVGAIHAVYGRRAGRRFLTSLCIGLFFTSLVLSVMYSRYKQVSSTVRETKVRLEREADPILYSYFTDPQLRPVYNQAHQYRMVKEGPEVVPEPLYPGGIWEELRGREHEFNSRLVTAIFEDSRRTELALLFWLEGSYIDPGFQWIDSICLFAFNVLLDFTSVTIILLGLERLKPPRSSFRRSLSAFVVALTGTLGCAGIAFLSYRLFFRGDTSFFWQILVVLPLSLFAAAVALLSLAWLPFLLYQLITKQPDPEDSPNLIGTIIFGGVFGAGGYQGLRYVWSYWHRASLGVVYWRDAFSLPYGLAATTLVPATLALLAFALMLLAKVSAEPARVLPESYMTFMREEVGGTQVAGIILLLGVFTGVIFTLIWPPPP
jgi:hypothetical protein